MRCNRWMIQSTVNPELFYKHVTGRVQPRFVSMNDAKVYMWKNHASSAIAYHKMQKCKVVEVEIRLLEEE